MLDIEIASQQHFLIMKVDAPDQHHHCGIYLFLLFRWEIYHKFITYTGWQDEHYLSSSILDAVTQNYKLHVLLQSQPPAQVLVWA